MTTRCVWGDVGVCVHMCVCVCVCMRAYVCVLVCLCMCVYISAPLVCCIAFGYSCVWILWCLLVRVSVLHQELHVEKPRHIRIYTYIPVCVYLRVRSCVCERLHVCVDVCVDVCIICSMFMSTGLLFSRR